MYQITVIGAGNLAWSLIPNLQGAGMNVHQLISRSREKLDCFQERYKIKHINTQFDELLIETDMVFLTVPDAAIEPLAAELDRLNRKNTIFLHTSGSMPLSALEKLGGSTAVFYPMQTFTRSKVVGFENVPVFLEGSEQVLKVIEPLARKCTNRVFFLNSEDRQRLHMGAVWVNNFPNMLFRIAHQLMPQHAGLDFSIFEPLVREHIDKVFAFQPENTQTGPAARADLPTIRRHLNLLKETPHYQSLYKQLSILINPDLRI